MHAVWLWLQHTKSQTGFLDILTHHIRMCFKQQTYERANIVQGVFPADCFAKLGSSWTEPLKSRGRMSFFLEFFSVFSFTDSKWPCCWRDVVRCFSRHSINLCEPFQLHIKTSASFLLPKKKNCGTHF